MLFAASNRFSPGIVALDARTGKLRWSANVGDRLVIIGANHLIFTLTQERGVLTILDAATGRVIRTLAVPGYIYGGVSDLLIAGGTFYIVDEKGVVALRP